MKTMMLILLLLPAVAFATADPDPDGIGIYFDSDADIACTAAVPAVPFDAFLVITRPSADEVWAIEFSMCTEVSGGYSSHLFLLDKDWNTDFLDLGLDYDWCADGRAVSFLEPVPRVGDNVVLVRLTYMILSDVSVEFFLGPHPAESIADGLPAYADTERIHPLHVSSGDPALPVARVNGDCSVVPAETSTFGRLKAVYR